MPSEKTFGGFGVLPEKTGPDFAENGADWIGVKWERPSRQAIAWKAEFSRRVAMDWSLAYEKTANRVGLTFEDGDHFHSDR